MSHRMCFFKEHPKVVNRKFVGPAAEVSVGNRLDQPICAAEDAGDGTPVWSVLVPTGEVAAKRADPRFLGVGLAEVKRDHPAIYAKLAEKLVEADDPKNPGAKIRVRRPMEAAEAVGETVIAADLPSHTFGGFDPITGEPEKKVAVAFDAKSAPGRGGGL